MLQRFFSRFSAGSSYPNSYSAQILHIIVECLYVQSTSRAPTTTPASTTSTRAATTTTARHLTQEQWEQLRERAEHDRERIRAACQKHRLRIQHRATKGQSEGFILNAKYRLAYCPQPKVFVFG